MVAIRASTRLVVLGFAFVIIAAGQAAAGEPFPPPPVPPPPPFSFEYPLPDPSACLCLPNFMVQDPHMTHFWWARAAGSGDLGITLVALQVNAAEQGRATMRVFDMGGVLRGAVAVEHPAAAGTEATAPPVVIASPPPGSVYRLEVRVEPRYLGQTEPLARHYTLRLHGATLLGTHSPLSAQAEAPDALWHVNVLSGESLNVVVFPGPEAPATTGNVTAYRPDGSLAMTVPLGFPMDIVGAMPGMWGLAIRGFDHHYQIDKRSGADRGLYAAWDTSGYGDVSGSITRAGSVPNTIPVEILMLDLASGAIVRSASGVTDSYGFSKVPVGRYLVILRSAEEGIGEHTRNLILTCMARAIVDFDLPDRPPRADAGEDQVVVEGATVLLDAGASSDPDGDPLTFSWATTVLSGPGVILSAPGTADPSFGTRDDGEYLFTVTVSDPFGQRSSVGVGVRVLNAAPVVDAGGDFDVMLGEAIALEGLYSDAGSIDTHAATIDWGDGVLEPLAASGGLVTASHTYASAGSYPILVCVTDDDGATACDATSAAVRTPPPGPPEPGPGERLIEAGAIDDHDCDGTEWHFVINQVRSGVRAPASIFVEWANGESATVELSRMTGQTAHYYTTLNLGSMVVGAYAVIAEQWTGEFRLSHGPC
ncbi:MAG: hypothetical protein HYT80_04455 [Euryarchaeota archaeon]|nr:hypothetical protein [Euryarchaeota archaeon]